MLGHRAEGPPDPRGCVVLTPGAEVVTHHVPGGIPVDEGCPRELSVGTQGLKLLQAKAKTRELFRKTPSRKLGSSSPTAEPPPSGPCSREGGGSTPSHPGWEP